MKLRKILSVMLTLFLSNYIVANEKKATMEEACGINKIELKLFVNSMKVGGDDVDFLSSHFGYPFHFKYKGKSITAKSRKEMKKIINNDKNIIKLIKQIFENENLNKSFYNSDGIMFNNGEIWVSRVIIKCDDKTYHKLIIKSLFI
jgi:hypothetical protein